ISAASARSRDARSGSSVTTPSAAPSGSGGGGASDARDANGVRAQAAASTRQAPPPTRRRIPAGSRTMRREERQLDTPVARREHGRVLVLASASPRRRQLLGWLGVP